MISYDKFKSNLVNYIERAKRIKTKIIISISVPDEKMVVKNKDILINVNRFNELYRDFGEQYNYVHVTQPLNPESEDFSIYEDGYHTHSRGHNIILNRLVEKFNGIS